METKKPMTVDIAVVKKMKKSEIIDLFDKTQRAYHEYFIQISNEYERTLDSVRGELLNHPDYISLKEQYDQLKNERDQAIKEKRMSAKRADELQSLLRQYADGVWKKPGRKPLNPAVVDRIRELRATGLSIRGIVKQLESEGMTASKGTVCNYINDQK